MRMSVPPLDGPNEGCMLLMATRPMGEDGSTSIVGPVTITLPSQLAALQDYVFHKFCTWLLGRFFIGSLQPQKMQGCSLLSPEES